MKNTICGTLWDQNLTKFKKASESLKKPKAVGFDDLR